MKLLITDAYRTEQARLHGTGVYGTAALQYGQTVSSLLNSIGARSLLDYGCGSKRSLLQALKLPEDVVYEGYDPAIPEYASSPCPAELVTCIDVLEHIEPSLLDNVLDHLAELCDPYGFFTIHTGPAVKVLSDGRNAHLTQEGPDWWLPRLKTRFQVLETRNIPEGLALVVRSLQSSTQLHAPGPLQLPIKIHGGDATPSKAPKSAFTPLTGIEHEGIRMVFNTPNETTAWRVQTIYEKEPHTLRWIASMAPEAVLFDVGANVGMYTVFAAMTRKMKVFAFEPESQNYALLNANIATNRLSEQVLAFPLALSDQMQVDRLFLSQFVAGGSCHSFGDEVGFDLKPRDAAFAQGSFSMTIDQLVTSGSIPVPDYIKLDVDGFEHKVLKGAAQTLANPKVREILIEINTHLEEHQRVIEFLQSLGFSYDIAQAQNALRKSGAFEGVGEFIFKRNTLAGNAAVDFKKKFLIHIAPGSRERAVMRHLCDRVAEAPLITEPFPYAVVDNVFPDDYYAEILAHFPALDSLTPLGSTGRVVSEATYRERNVVLFNNEQFARLSNEQQRFWRNCASWMYSDLFLNLFVLKFQHALETRLERILASEPALKARGDALLVNDVTNYAIGPHTDLPHRLVSFLFYLPQDTELREFGTSIYRPKDPNFVCWGGPHHPFDQFERVRTVEFLPNRLLVFPKTERSFHGVEPIRREGVNRQLLINNIRVLNTVTH